MKMPVSFDQFQKNPVAAIAFIAIVAIGYLYVDQKMTNGKIDDRCQTRVTELEVKVDKYVEHIRRLDSALAYTSAKNEMLIQTK
jgi:archaellum component FlaF (FlaF/FlaG flagellin family)